MTRIATRPRASADPTARVVDLTAYRNLRRDERDLLPLFAQAVEPPLAPRAELSENEVAHRKLMLQHLEAVRR